MSILIKDMEMPKNCALCKLRGAGETWCPFTLREVPGNTIPEDCPLVPIPPHGRLIDETNILKVFSKEVWGFHTDFAKGIQSVLTEINAAPTIIPAEEDET